MGHKTKPKVISLGKGLVGWWVGGWGWEERTGWRVIRSHSRHIWNCQITKLTNREEQTFRGLNLGCQASRQVPLPAEPSSHHPLPFALVTLSTALFSHFLVFQLMTHWMHASRRALRKWCLFHGSYHAMCDALLWTVTQPRERSTSWT